MCTLLGARTHGKFLFEAWKVDLKEGDYNPQAKQGELSIAVGGVFFRYETNAIAAPWPEHFSTGLKDLVMRHRVRVLAGIFDGDPGDLGRLLRDCGAAGTGALALAFWCGSAQAYVTHPHYIVILGPAQVRETEPDAQPAIPEWWNLALHSPQRRGGYANRLQHRQLDWAARPTWCPLTDSERHEQGTDEWPHLHRVIFKAQSANRLRPHCHCLHVYIDSKSRKSGRGATARKKARQKEEKDRRRGKKREEESDAASAAAGARAAQGELEGDGRDDVSACSLEPRQGEQRGQDEGETKERKEEEEEEEEEEEQRRTRTNRSRYGRSRARGSDRRRRGREEQEDGAGGRSPRRHRRPVLKSRSRQSTEPSQQRGPVSSRRGRQERGGERQGAQRLPREATGRKRPLRGKRRKPLLDQFTERRKRLRDGSGDADDDHRRNGARGPRSSGGHRNVV